MVIQLIKKLKSLLRKSIRWEIFKNDGYIGKIFENSNGTVLSGPFQGMKYINHAKGSALLPKLMGTYESELHSVIKYILSKDYKNIYIIGSAEGYYAIGLATHFKSIQKKISIKCYDTDLSSHESLMELASLNDVTSYINISSQFTKEDFNDLVYQDLIICDIEGDEESLFQLNNYDCFYGVDLLIEVHESGLENGVIKKMFEAKFNKTHDIEIIPYVKYRANIFDFLPKRIFEEYAGEGRIKGLEWAWLKSKKLKDK